LPDLAPELQEAINIKFGDEFNQTVTKYLKLQGVTCSPDIKYADMIILTEQVKEAGAKPIQIGKLKDWCQTQSQVMPSLSEQSTPPADNNTQLESDSGKKKKPPPKRDTRPMRSNSTNDVVEGDDVQDPMQKTLDTKFGKYSDAMQSFLMTQGVMEEDDLMIRDILKMMTTAQNVGLKPVQLAKLKEWMTELKELGDVPAPKPILPHERRGSKLKVSKSAIAQTGKEYDNAVRASRASRDMEGLGSFDSESGGPTRRSSRTSEGSVPSRRASKSSANKSPPRNPDGEIMVMGAVRRNSKLAAASEGALSL
jgi:hypothetical protein